MLDLQTNAWSERNADGATPAARRGASFVVLSQKSAYLFGGESASRVRRYVKNKADVAGQRGPSG